MTPPRSPFRMDHKELQTETIKLAKMYGFDHLHVRRSIGKGRQWVTATNVKGWPDLLLWSPERQPGRHIAVELKVPPDDLHVDQRECLVELAGAGFEVWVLTEEWLQKFARFLAAPSTRDKR